MIPRHAAIAMALLLIGSLSMSCHSDRNTRWYCRDSGFSISFPKEWKVRENVLGTRIIAEIPDEGEISIIRQNVNVVVETVRAPLSVGQYVELQMNGLRKLKGVTIFHRGGASVSGTTAMWFSYRYTINDFGYRAVVYALNKGTTFYVITGISQSNTFGSYERVFHDTAQSFRLE